MFLLLAFPFGSLISTGILLAGVVTVLVVPASIPLYPRIWPIAVALAF